MGMFDTLNGEQVKCFSWVTYGHGDPCGEIFSAHGGSCDYFNTGDEVPWKSLTYNYTRNFLIVDLDNSSSMDVSCPVIVHRIVDGKLEGTYYPKEDDISEDLFWPDFRTIGYMGEELNIHSIPDLYEYYRDTRDQDRMWKETWEKYPDHRGELSRLAHARPKDQSSPEYMEFLAKSAELMQKIDKVREDRQVELDSVTGAFRKKWNVPDTHAWERTLGYFLEASEHPMFEKDEKLRREFQERFREWFVMVPEDTQKCFFEWNGTKPEDRKAIRDWVRQILRKEPWDGRVWSRAKACPEVEREEEKFVEDLDRT
jgi:hypothetical protein